MRLKDVLTFQKALARAAFASNPFEAEAAELAVRRIMVARKIDPTRVPDQYFLSRHISFADNPLLQKLREEYRAAHPPAGKKRSQGSRRAGRLTAAPRPSVTPSAAEDTVTRYGKPGAQPERPSYRNSDTDSPFAEWLHNIQQGDRNARRREQRALEAENRKQNHTPQRCAAPGCDNLLDPVRSTRRFCCDACRQKAYRQRKK
jgi:hypothetical protein